MMHKQVTSLQDTALKINLYPNPAKDYAILHISKDIASELQLKITNTVGQGVFDGGITMVNDNYIINTSKYSSGLYFVNLYGNSGKLFAGKLSIMAK
jgi:hypothetical protein